MRTISRRKIMQMTAGASLAAAVASPALSAAGASRKGGKVIRVENLDLSFMQQGWGTPHKNESVGGRPLRVAGVTYKHGIGTHAASYFNIHLFGGARRFTALCGVNEAARTGRVRFEVFVDGKRVAQSPVMTGKTPAFRLSADLRGAKDLLLVVEPATDSIDFDHADWIEPIIEMMPNAGNMPKATQGYLNKTIPDIASGDPDYPEFHGPRVVGCSPGKDFLFAVPHTGVKPVHITAERLPDGLQMNERGFITGRVKEPGEYKVKLKAVNSHGTAERVLKILCGENMLARTPAMGWNSWNAYGMNNSSQRTKDAADAMVSSGLAAKGFMYINIDDGWQNGREPDGTIRTTDKFPSMKDLVDHVHALGLRFGLYSSPGPTTCGGHTGSFGHVQKDAETYAKWGVDYLKYDWCSYGQEVPPNPDLEQFIKPYREMSGALRSSSRDIYFSLCQYGMAHVWTWGGMPPVWGNSYRISGDINDSWQAMINNGFGSDGPLFPFAGPGHWNDPDMLVVGYGTFEDGPLHWTKLTPDEQLTHITLWCMLAAPLLLGCDLTKLNKFTTDLMTNTEVLAVNQDELGKQAQRVYHRGSMEVWARPLFDGTVAVAIFNLGLVPREIKIPSWSMVRPVIMPGAKPPMGVQPVRDLWRRKDLGSHAGYSAVIRPHSALMLKVGHPNPETT
jgi:alpha-galactosidase